MEITNLTFILTADCNFNCTYCIQKKEKKTVDLTTIETATDFFYPFLSHHKTNHIAFYGGEPLLAYNQLKRTVLLLSEKNKTRGKKIQFSITTNGSLLTDPILDFFQAHRFNLVLSFDGLAQDSGRKKGSLETMVEKIKRIREYPGIQFEINSVFSPRTIRQFSSSMRYMIEPGGPEVTFNISTMEEWSSANLEVLKTELNLLTDYLVRYYQRTGEIPVKNFQGNPDRTGMFHCCAGKGRIALTPEGDLWGCSLFYDYAKTCGRHQNRDYSFGRLADFMSGYQTIYPAISANYQDLRQDFFQVQGGQFCFLCDDVQGCVVCPANAAYSSGSLGKISCRMCGLTKIQRNAWRDLARRVKPLPKVPGRRPSDSVSG